MRKFVKRGEGLKGVPKIYKMTNVITGEVYVGSTVKYLSGRFNTHFYDAVNNRGGHTAYTTAELIFWGKDCFTIEVLEICESTEQAKEREQYWIGYYDCYNSGLNGSADGLGKIKRKVAQLDKNTGKIIALYESLITAENITGISYKNIQDVCANRSKTAGGYNWEYAS